MEQILAGKIMQLLDSGRNPKKLGLFKGKAGICLALYAIAKKNGSHVPEQAADSLLDEIVGGLPRVKSTSFDKGLSGIGWTVDRLHRWGCVSGDIDSILFYVDAAVYRAVTNKNYSLGISLADGLLGYMAYLTARLSNPGHNTDGYRHRLLTAALRVAIDKTQDIMPSIFPSVPKDFLITAMDDFPLLFVMMRRSIELGVYSHKIASMVRNWEMYIRGYIPYYNVNKLSLAASLAYLHKALPLDFIGRQANDLLYLADIDNIHEEIDERIENINEGWYYCALVLYEAARQTGQGSPWYADMEKARTGIVSRHLQESVGKIRNDDSDEDISLVNGLSGVALLLSLAPEAFQATAQQ